MKWFHDHFSPYLLQKHGLKLYFRNPNSYTPLLSTKKYLLLGDDMLENRKQIAKFSVKDAEVLKIAADMRMMM